MWGDSNMVLLGLHHLITNTQLVTLLLVKFFFGRDGSKRKLCSLLTWLPIWIISINDMRVFSIASEEVRSIVGFHCLAHSNCFRRISFLMFIVYWKMECYKLQLLFKLSVILVSFRYQCLNLWIIFYFRFWWCDCWEQCFVWLQESLLLLWCDIVSVIWHNWDLFYWFFL